MLVGHSIEEPLDILFGTYNAWQTQNFDGGIIGVYAHIHVALLTDGHDSLQEVLHILTQFSLVDTFVQVEELAELLDRSLIILREVTRDKALCLDDDILYQLVVFLRCHGLS